MEVVLVFNILIMDALIINNKQNDTPRDSIFLKIEKWIFWINLVAYILLEAYEYYLSK